MNDFKLVFKMKYFLDRLFILFSLIMHSLNRIEYMYEEIILKYKYL